MGWNNDIYGYVSNYSLEGCLDHRVSVLLLEKEILISCSIWTKYTFIAIPGSMVIWFIFLPLVSYVGPLLPVDIFMEYYGIIPELFGNINYWLFFIIVPLMCVLRDYLWK